MPGKMGLLNSPTYSLFRFSYHLNYDTLNVINSRVNVINSRDKVIKSRGK